MNSLLNPQVIKTFRNGNQRTESLTILTKVPFSLCILINARSPSQIYNPRLQAKKKLEEEEEKNEKYVMRLCSKRRHIL